MVAEAADAALPDGWRGHLEDLLFDDMDYELLYDPAHDGIEEDPAAQPPGMASMRFTDWFRPFNDERTLPPYALPAPPSADASTAVAACGTGPVYPAREAVLLRHRPA